MEKRAPFRGQEDKDLAVDRKDSDYIWELARKWDDAKVKCFFFSAVSVGSRELLGLFET